MNASDWTSEEFERRVHEHRDERRDPFADEGIAAWLDAHPERLERLAREQELLGLLSGSRALRRRRAPWWLPAAAAVLVALGAALHGTRATPGDAPRARIVAAELTEIRAPHGATASFTEREILIDTAGARLELFTFRSQPR